MNTMMMSGYQAVIAFDPDLYMFGGEFVGLNGEGLAGRGGDEHPSQTLFLPELMAL